MKKRNSIITVNLGVISHNLNVLRSHCKPNVKQMAVVKADAYGHGAVKVARFIADQVEWFAVNDVHEAMELRENGIENPVLVFGVPEQDDAGLYKEYRITATISSLDHFQRLQPGTAYHLNFDTGMSRLGFRPEQAGEVRKAVKNHGDLTCTGIYSHFATADEPESGKMKQQLKVFKDIRAHFEPDLLTHMCNTAGTVQYPDAQFDIVRNGIGMYGYSPGETNIPELEPALCWNTKIVQVNPLLKSESVSYGATWQAKENGYIGIIPVGYADGIPRGLSGNFSVIIAGEKYPVAGRVTMNYCMIYLGDKKFEAETEVQLLNKKLNAAHWADAMRTIPYEILTGLSRNSPREYTGF